MRGNPESREWDLGQSLERLQYRITSVDLMAGGGSHFKQCTTTSIPKSVACAFMSMTKIGDVKQNKL